MMEAHNLQLRFVFSRCLLLKQKSASKEEIPTENLENVEGKKQGTTVFLNLKEQE